MAGFRGGLGSLGVRGLKVRVWGLGPLQEPPKTPLIESLWPLVVGEYLGYIRGGGLGLYVG